MKQQKQRLTNIILGCNLFSEEDLAELLAKEEEMNNEGHSNSLSDQS